MTKDLLLLLEKNARISCGELATMLETDEAQVEAAVAALEADGTIRGYTAIIDWEKTNREYVSARIELKVTPKKDRGFEELAEKISRYSEVQSLYLMSGGYDLALTIVGKTFKDIAFFVAHRLAPLDSVQSTTTHFILRKYKQKGVVLEDGCEDERRVVL